MELRLDNDDFSDARKLRAVSAMLVSYSAAYGNVIDPADNPETGRAATTADLVKTLVERVPNLPDLNLTKVADTPAAVVLTPNPGDVFGGAAVPLPPPPAMPQAGAPAVAGSAPSPGSAAIPPAPPAASLPGGVELDVTGLPWDNRLHSESRAKTKDGKWRAKRNLNDAAKVAAIEAELRAVQALPRAAAPPPPPLPPGGAASPAIDPAAALAFGTSTETPPGPPLPPSPPPAPPAAGAMDFAGMMVQLTPAMSQGRITTALLNEACQSVGVPGLPLLPTRQDLVPAVFEYIKARVQL